MEGRHTVIMNLFGKRLFKSAVAVSRLYAVELYCPFTKAIVRACLTTACMGDEVVALSASQSKAADVST